MSVVGVIIPVFVIILILSVMVSSLRTGGQSGQTASIPESTVYRTRVETGNAYVNDCVVDEIGWIDNETSLSRELKYFYEQTGCQPYIILKAYDQQLTSTDACETWTQEYYDTNFAERQNVLLYVYFCDEYDEGIGNDTLWMGTEASTVMDSEAVEIFWAYLDYDWDAWDVNDNDGMFADVFTQTADKIMYVSTTKEDVQKSRAVAVIVAVLVIGGIVALVLVFRRKHQKAQETIDILNAPLDTADRTAEDLADKYK